MIVASRNNSNKKNKEVMVFIEGKGTQPLTHQGILNRRNISESQECETSGLMEVHGQKIKGQANRRESRK
jgi:hypothetical protein